MNSISHTNPNNLPMIKKISIYGGIVATALLLSSCSTQQVARSTVAVAKLPGKAATAAGRAAGATVGGAVGGVVAGKIGRKVGSAVGRTAGGIAAGNQ